MKTVGVLGFQGSVYEHLNTLSKIDNVKGIEIKKASDIEKADSIILPGGESTTISKLLDRFDMKAPLKKRIQDGMPVWGTCAGMILLAKKISGESPHLAVMDIAVKRNAFGRQTESFNTYALIPEVFEKNIPLIFIRAPWVECCGKNVKVLCKVNDKIVAVRENKMLATSFHPELSESIEFHKYFCNIS